MVRAVAGADQVSEMPDLVTVREVAELLRLNEAHVRDRLSKRRDFPPAYRIGGLRWERQDILDWIEAQRVSPASRRATRQAPRNKATGLRGSDAQPSAQAQEA